MDKISRPFKTGNFRQELKLAKTASKTRKYFLEEAAAVAQKSTMRAKHGCVLVRNGQIISRGFNHLKPTAMYHRKASIHAEVDAIMKSPLRYFENNNDVDIYVIRLDTSCNLEESDTTEFVYSRPCNNCKKAIKKYGFRRCFYTVV